ncbi:MAG: fluoride efflux transporter CrcB [Acidobacteriota bacterium]|nr:fluoride efflux transporter CrcB [Acidobacteriota bacterium]MDQ3170988.1 fluoride efflux transporter CrcB [Acidobacteriota bacterium]
MLWAAIALGGGLGAVARHALNSALQGAARPAFPYGILLVNVLGSAAAGILLGLVVSHRIQLSDTARAFVLVGVLGGFTTFSAFSLDTLELARAGHAGRAMLNVAGNVGLGLLAVWAGFRVAGGA